MQATADEKQATSADFYFDQKARFSTHETLIKDRVRSKALMGCVANNKNHLRGANVIVLGSGIGLLPFHIGKQGARKVVGVESSAIIEQARQLAKDNQLAHVVEFVHGEMGKPRKDGTSVDLPFEEGSVDVIICEWVGHLGTNDPMLRQLISARDKYLKKAGGIIIPNKATLMLSACEDRNFKTGSVDFWDNVYGFRMDVMKKLVYREPVVSTIPSRQMVTRAVKLLEVDAATVTLNDLDWKADWTLQSIKKNEYIHYLVTYFIMEFNAPSWSSFRISTAPDAPPTHWQQTAFCLEEDLPINHSDTVSGTFSQRLSDDGNDCHCTIDVKMATKTFTTEYTQQFQFRNS